MSDKLFFNFQIDERTSTIKVERAFAAPLDLVWRAWTVAEILDQWWAPEGWKSSTKNMEFKEGGMRHYRMQGPDNFEMWGITSYSKIQQHINFSGEEYSADEDAVISDELPTSTYHITFHDQDGSTLIKHNTSYQNVEQMKKSLEYGFEEGMLGAFARLDIFIDH